MARDRTNSRRRSISAEDTAECCVAQVDKQISCDSGFSWVDQGFDDAVAVVNTQDDDRRLLVSADTLVVEEDGQATIDVSLAGRPGAPLNLLLSLGSGDADLQLVGDSVLTIEPDEWEHKAAQTGSRAAADGHVDQQGQDG